MKRKMLSRSFLSFTAAALLSGSAWAIQPPLAGDTFVSLTNPTTNYGAAGALTIGDQTATALLQFDLSLIPAGSRSTPLISCFTRTMSAQPARLRPSA